MAFDSGGPGSENSFVSKSRAASKPSRQNHSHPDPLYIGSCDYCSPPGSQTRLGCSHYRQKLVWVCHNILFQTDHPDRPGLRELLPEPEKPRWETGVRSCQRGRKVDPKPKSKHFILTLDNINYFQYKKEDRLGDRDKPNDMK